MLHTPTAAPAITPPDKDTAALARRGSARVSKTENGRGDGGRSVPERSGGRPRRRGALLRGHPVAVRDVVDHLHLGRRRREEAAGRRPQPREPSVRRRAGALRRHRARMQRRLRHLRHLPRLACSATSKFV